MRLNTLSLSNFRQHADTRIIFDTGLTGVIGPNGSGKSTILEAIAWAVYGNQAVRGTRDTIRFNRAPPRSTVCVELDFELGGHRYRVVRGLTSAELYLDGGDAPIADSITGVTELLQRRLGMTREEFFNTYFTGQKELSVMAAMGPSQRAQFLSQVLGYERLREAQQLVRERRSELSAQMSGLRQGMPDPEVVMRAVRDAEARIEGSRLRAEGAAQRRAVAESSLSTVRPRWEGAQRERERVLEMLGELRVAESEEAASARDLERLDRELAEISAVRADREQLTQALAPLTSLVAEFQRLDILAREEGKRTALANACRTLGEELARMRDRRARVESAPGLDEEVTRSINSRRHDLVEVEGRLEERRTEWVRDRQEAETKRQALRDQYAELKQQRDRLAGTGEDGACPTCLRPLGKSLEPVLEMLDAQIETIRVDGAYYKARLDQLHEMPEEIVTLDGRRHALAQEVAALERRLVKVQLAVSELAQLGSEIEIKEDRLTLELAELEAIPAGYDPQRHEMVKRERDRLALIEARANKMLAQIEREPQLMNERARTAAQNGAVQLRVRTLRAARDAAQLSDSAFAALRELFENATAALRTADLDLVAAQGELAAARAAREIAESAARELAHRQRSLAELQSAKRLHDELDRAYTDLRTDLNYQLRPELSEIASSFLSELTDGRYTELELDDQYNVIVLEDGMPKPVISGGEEDLANLVLRLAISQMIAERAGQPFSLLILDEIFGSLDEMRRTNVIELLRNLQDRFEQVVLITHIESVRERVDHVVTVRYDEERGASEVVQQTLEPSDLELGLSVGEPTLELTGSGD